MLIEMFVIYEIVNVMKNVDAIICIINQAFPCNGFDLSVPTFGI